MSTQTQHIGLHQWESTDPFLREDFNQDHQLIDAALERTEGKADRALSGLEGVGYNVYNLLLRDYYEGKYTGFKKGLMFDGFLDESRISSWEGGAYRDAATHAISVDTTGQPSVPRPSEINTTLKSALPKQYVSQEWTAQGNGTITAVSVYGATPSYGQPHNVTFSIWRDGEKLADSATQHLFIQNSGSWYEFPVTCAIHKGYTYEFRFYNTGSGGSSGSIFCYLDTTNGTQSPVALGITVTPAGSTSGTAVSVPAQIGQWRYAVCYVRSNGDGQIAAQLGGGSAWESMVSGGGHAAETMDGAPCTEHTFTLDSSQVREDAALRLTMTAQSGRAPVVYDYGVIFTE